MKPKKYYEDLIGKKFRRLTITGYAEPTKRKNGRYYTNATYLCDCGNVGISPLTCIITRYHSCGCYEIENPSRRRHNMSKDRLFHIWSAMKHRCDDEGNAAFANYGGRGVTYCSEWRLSDIFFKWALESGYEPHLTLDRINVDGNYEPSNCRWATMKEQARNTRKSIKITINDVSKSLPEWCEILNASYSCVYDRIKRGWIASKIFKEKLTENDRIFYDRELGGRCNNERGESEKNHQLSFVPQ